MTANRAMGAVALVLAVLALVVGSPVAREQASATPGDPLDFGQVTAVQLGEWIKSRHGHLRLVDIRSAEAFAEFHLPTAEHLPLSRIADAEFTGADTAVVYGAILEDVVRAVNMIETLDVHPAATLYMDDGVSDWVSDIMNPTRTRDATEQEMSAFRQKAELSRYFGGLPRVVDGPIVQDAGPAALEKTRRRGCAF
jgi:rhodanese-related sulfurtransferase